MNKFEQKTRPTFITFNLKIHFIQGKNTEAILFEKLKFKKTKALTHTLR